MMAQTPYQQGVQGYNRGAQQYGAGSNTQLSQEEKNIIRRIITADEEAKELVIFAKSVAERIVRDGMTTSQIRNIFSEARRIEAFWEKDPQAARRRLQLLKPKLLYQAKRESKIEYYARTLTEAIDVVNNSPDTAQAFKKLMNFFEASLAYHKSLGGRD